jgi:RNA polymerase sigma-70 factor (ECF subfamily)
MPGWFATTHWSVVLAAGGSDGAQAQEALAKLCQTYWYAVYAYVRSRGQSPEDAQDLTQEFFVRLLEKKSLARITRHKGRSRSLLLTMLDHFLVDEWKRAKALKRGALKVISLDATLAETRYRLEPVETATPESIFERNRALALLDGMFAQLRGEFNSPYHKNFQSESGAPMEPVEYSFKTSGN